MDFNHYLKVIGFLSKLQKKMNLILENNIVMFSRSIL